MIDRLVIKNDGFSWAVRAKIAEGASFYTKTFPLLFKYYWSFSLFWLKIFPLLFIPGVILTLMRNIYRKFIKDEKIEWRDLLISDLGWKPDVALEP